MNDISDTSVKPAPRSAIRIRFLLSVMVLSTLVATIAGGLAGYLTGQNKNIFTSEQAKQTRQEVVTEESAIIAAVEKVTPAVVSIVVSKDLPIIERRYKNFDPFTDDPFEYFFGPQIEEYERGTQKQEIGGGSGFIVSANGLIVTNKHVVEDETADYTVLTNNGLKLEAEVLASHPTTDLAIIKVETEGELPFVELGTSSELKAGQLAIAIGNALGEFSNSVSVGVISGLSRSVTAGGFGVSTELLEGVIQTDAAINPGNSGGPLINLAGQVIGINTAIISNAENIGFAIPVEVASQALESVQEKGKITRPYLGVRYILINEEIQQANNLEIDYGALVVRGETMAEPAVMPGSPADKAGIQENDIILEVAGQKVTTETSLARLIGQKETGDTVALKLLSKGEEKTVSLELGEIE